MARREAEAAARAERLANDRRFGERAAQQDRTATTEEFAERLHAEAARDPRAGWDEERVASAVAGFASARGSEPEPEFTPGPSESSRAAVALGPQAARAALQRGRAVLTGESAISAPDAPDDDADSIAPQHATSPA